MGGVQFLPGDESDMCVRKRTTFPEIGVFVFVLQGKEQFDLGTILQEVEKLSRWVLAQAYVCYIGYIQAGKASYFRQGGCFFSICCILSFYFFIPHSVRLLVCRI